MLGSCRLATKQKLAKPACCEYNEGVGLVLRRRGAHKQKASLPLEVPEADPAATHLVLRALLSRILHKALLSSSVHTAAVACVINCLVAAISSPIATTRSRAPRQDPSAGGFNQRLRLASFFHDFPSTCARQEHRNTAYSVSVIKSKVRLPPDHRIAPSLSLTHGWNRRYGPAQSLLFVLC